MKTLLLILILGITSFGVFATERDFIGICEAYEDHNMPISRQHRYVKRLDVLSCRLKYRVYTQFRIWGEKGEAVREQVSEYRKAIKRLHECTKFTFVNTYEDRIYKCSERMTDVYHIAFKLSDNLTKLKYLISKNCWYVLLHNRRGLDIIMGQTKYPWPTRSWWDHGEPFPEE